MPDPKQESSKIKHRRRTLASFTSNLRSLSKKNKRGSDITLSNIKRLIEKDLLSLNCEKRAENRMYCYFKHSEVLSTKEKLPHEVDLYLSKKDSLAPRSKSVGRRTPAMSLEHNSRCNNLIEFEKWKNRLFVQNIAGARLLKESDQHPPFQFFKGDHRLKDRIAKLPMKIGKGSSLFQKLKMKKLNN